MPYQRVSKKPEGQPTRGKTASNRLRRVDNFILLYEPSLLRRTDGRFARALFVDLGYGFDARTTLESAARFRRFNPDLPILGVEIEKERVEAALRYADEKTFFRLGGFNLPLKEDEHVRLMRAFNMLRQYEEKDFAPAYERLAQYTLPGGLMIVGTSNPFGSIWCANVAMWHGRRWSLRAWGQRMRIGELETGDWRLWPSARISAWGLILPIFRRCCRRITSIMFCRGSQSMNSLKRGSNPRQRHPQ